MLRAGAVIDTLKLSGAEAEGAKIVKRSLASPMMQIAENAGLEGAVVVENVKAKAGQNIGLNALNFEIEDLVKAGVIDPAKVVRSALQNAVSIAGLVLTTETLVADLPEEDEDEEGDEE